MTVVDMSFRSDVVSMRGRFLAMSLVGYTALWVIEGGLRKWVPGANLLFYVLRDAATLGLLALALILGVPLARWARATIVALVALLAFALAQVVALQVPLPVAIYGFDTYAGAFVAFVLGSAADPSWLKKGLTAVLAASSVLNALITVAQVASPPGAFINREVDSDTAHFVNPGDVVRASGTFSSPLGLTIFVGVAAAVMFIWLLRARRGYLLCCVAAIASLCFVAALGGARGSVLIFGLVVAVFLISALAAPTPRSLVCAGGTILLLGCSFIFVQATFPAIIQSFSDRFQNASGSEDSSSRFLDYALSGVSSAPTLLGDGIGMHGNAAASFGATAGWIEADGARIVAELGVLGYCLCVARLLAGVLLVVVALKRVRRDPALLIAASGIAPLLIWLPIIQLPASSGGAAVAMLSWLAEYRRRNSERGDLLRGQSTQIEFSQS